MRWFSVSIMNTKANAKKAPMGCFFCLGKRDPNPYWFNIEIFAVIASNTLKILTPVKSDKLKDCKNIHLQAMPVRVSLA